MVIKAVVINWEDAPWMVLETLGVFAAHPRSLTKVIAGPKSEICKTDKFDFLVSIFEPGGGVNSHSHEKTGTEHIFHILKGRGIIDLDGEKRLLKRGTTVWIPPNVKHSIVNNEDEPLFMAVVSVPPE